MKAGAPLEGGRDETMEAHSPNGRPIISIFGSYSPRPGEPLYDQAYAVGHALARSGYVVCNGGYDGTMEASAKGARDAGGQTIGVTCAVFSDYRGMPLKANRWIDREILHDNVFSRIDCMMRMSAGYVVLEGGTGTLVELGVVWEYVCKGLIEPRPIFVVGDFWCPVVERIRGVRPKSCQHVYCVESSEAIVSRLSELLRATPPLPGEGYQSTPPLSKRGLGG
ncbi:MAG: hypothetical protein AMXMBFR13_10910 [Phycisphaerae bacterium]